MRPGGIIHQNPQHPMSQFGAENAIKFIVLMIWKLRKQCPNLECVLDTKLMDEFTRVFAGQRPSLAILGGQDSVTLRLIDETGAALLVVSPEAQIDHPAVKEMEAMLQARKDAPLVAELLRTQAEWLKDRQVLETADVEPTMFKAAEMLMLLSGPHEPK